MRPIDYFSRFCAFCCGSREKEERDEAASPKLGRGIPKPETRVNACADDGQQNGSGGLVCESPSFSPGEKKMAASLRLGGKEAWQKASVTSIMLSDTDIDTLEAKWNQEPWQMTLTSIPLTASCKLDDSKQSRGA